MSRGTHRTFSKHTQCSSFLPKSQKEKALPHKINNPPTHSLKQIHRGRDDRLCVVPCRSSGSRLLRWRPPSVRAASWACPAMGHPRWGLGLSDPAGRDAWLLPYPLARETVIFHQGDKNTQGARSYRLCPMVCRSWSSSCWTGTKWFLWLMAEMSFKLIAWHGFDFKKKIYISIDLGTMKLVQFALQSDPKTVKVKVPLWFLWTLDWPLASVSINLCQVPCL